MSKINTEGEPIFVDVDSGQQFPTLFSQLITAEEASALARAGTSKRIERVKVDTSQNVAKDDTKQIEAENACRIIQQSFSCNVCDQYKTDTEQKLMRHLRLHRGDNLVSDSTNTQKTAKANAQLKKLEKACTKIVERPFSCDVCQRYKAETEEQLIRHLRRHRGENPFQCGMCEYSTYNKAVFEEHERVHQGIKPFTCPHCNYSSASKKNAKKHQRIHSDDNPNKCKDCDFIGRNPQSFRHHRETQHNAVKSKRALICKHCGTKFSAKAKYHTHRKNGKKCTNCMFKCCSAKIYYEHMKEVHNEDAEVFSKTKKSKTETKIFKCALCEWSSNSKSRVLLHLIHHPNQKVDESVIDLTVLRNCGIVE